MNEARALTTGYFRETHPVLSARDGISECLALASLPLDQRPKPISTGIPSLDLDMRGGVLPGKGEGTWVLAARSGVGKTTVAIAAANGSQLMLPLRDFLGRTCAFSGRSLAGEEPKYRNSANDALFCKNQILLGLHQAASAIRRSGEALLVEGPIDVIQLHQAGLDHAVASLGTAFSIEQAHRLIRSGTKRLSVALDGDKAGQTATARLTEGLRPLDSAGHLGLLVVALPPGDEPDSLVRRDGAQGLQHHLAQARHWLTWELERLLDDLQADPDDLSALQR